MTFAEARTKMIECLEKGGIQHETRQGFVEEKNLLAAGLMTPEEVVRLLKAGREDQYKSSPHHQDASILVHEFKPEKFDPKESMHIRWYIKGYFVDPDVMMISVHKSTVPITKKKTHIKLRGMRS